MILAYVSLSLPNSRSMENPSELYWQVWICLVFQVDSLIKELSSAAAAEKGLLFDEGMEDRLCAYSRAVAHFPTAVKEVNSKKLSWMNVHELICVPCLTADLFLANSSNGVMVGSTLWLRRQLQKGNLIPAPNILPGSKK